MKTQRDSIKFQRISGSMMGSRVLWLSPIWLLPGLSLSSAHAQPGVLPVAPPTMAQAQPTGANRQVEKIGVMQCANSPVASIARQIANNYGLKVLVSTGSPGNRISIRFQDITPEAALVKLAQVAHLSLTQGADGTYILSYPAPNAPPIITLNAPQPAPAALEAPFVLREARPYTLSIRAGNTMNQEIQVKEHDTFHLLTSIRSVQWLLEGTTDVEGDQTMQVALHAERVEQIGEAKGKSSLTTRLTLKLREMINAGSLTTTVGNMTRESNILVVAQKNIAP